MCSGNAERRDEHGETSKQEHSSSHGEKSPQQDCSRRKVEIVSEASISMFPSPILVEHQNTNPNGKQQATGDLTSPECPSNVRDVVKEDVGKRWVSFGVGDTFMHHNHDKSSDPRHQECIAWNKQNTT
jgi:hypothetical protein